MSPNDGTMLFVVDARDDKAPDQALEMSRFNRALARRLAPAAAMVGASPEMAHEAMAAMAQKRPRGATVRALCPVDGRFRYWVAYTNVALTDAEVDFLCWECDSRPAPDLPNERTIVDFGGFQMSRAEIRRAVRRPTH
ncbi:MAG: hypothetical protein F4X36_10780 [Gammaproteobacteria bacterium]|nr:hypothetical protein [Gammaproteobacteria bacterium]